MGKNDFTDPLKTGNVSGFVIGRPLHAQPSPVVIYRNGGDFVYPTTEDALLEVEKDSSGLGWKIYRVLDLDVYEV